MIGLTLLHILLIAAGVLLLALTAYLWHWNHWVKKIRTEMAFTPKDADDYTVPRYVYENFTESTEYEPKNGRIVGYRISPNLVINSHIYQNVNSQMCENILRDKLLNKGPEVAILENNLEAISILREKAGEPPLNLKWFWIREYNYPIVVNLSQTQIKVWSDKDKYPAILKY